MESKSIKLFLASTFIVLTANLTCWSQIQERTPYYIDLNHVAEGVIHEISDLHLHLAYYDAYGTTSEFNFKIYDWKRSIVAGFTMDKSFGLNNYTIKLDEAYSGWEIDKIYVGELKNENGTLYKLPIRIVGLPDIEDPAVNIMVNPRQVGCSDLSKSLVEFYGEIKGGKAPYKVTWFVLNSARTDFLYQPKEELIKLAGKTALIRVDKNPEYYVVLYVKDACGSEQRKIVNMVCGKDMKKINTIFVEELNSTLFKDRQAIK